MSELLKEIDEALKPYECKYHTWPSNDTPHGCTDCYNTGYVFDNPEAQLLVKVYDHMHSLTAENEKLKRELHQQRFNNENNLSIDQKVADEIAKLKRIVEVLEPVVEDYILMHEHEPNCRGQYKGEEQNCTCMDLYYFNPKAILKTARQAKEEVERIREGGK